MSERLHRRTRLVAAALGACFGLGLVGCASTGAPGPEAPPAPEAAPAPLLGEARQLTFAGRRTGEGYYDATGERMVFQSEREPGNPFYQIYLMDLETGDTRRVSPGVGKTTCAWVHPSGRRVLFASTHLDPEARAKQEAELAAREAGRERRYSWDYDPHYDLFARDLASGELERLTDAHGYDAEGAYSPDGRFVVFASNRHAFDEITASVLTAEERKRRELEPSYFVDLYLLDLRDRSLTRLTDTPGYDGGPFFSPDGRRIVWRRFSEDGLTAEIFTMRTDGTDVRQLTELGAMSWAPFYHPSGDYVIFSTNVHGMANFELYVVDVEGESEPVRVTESEGFDGLPVFHPEGHTLAFTSNRSPRGRSQIFRAPWNDEAAREALGIAPRRHARAAPLLPLPADTEAAIRAEDARAWVARLTDPATEGRLTGTRGERFATGFVARAFRAMGLEPAGAHGSYFEEFEFSAGVSLGPGNRLETAGREWTPDADWRPLAFSRTGRFEAAPVVFGGYGIVAPADGEEARDDLADLELEGRWLLVLRYLPEELPRETRQALRPYSALRYKAMVARDRGALGLLVASGPRSRVREELVPLRFDGSLGKASIGALSVSDELAGAVLAAAGHELAELQAALDRGEGGPGFETGVQLSATIDLVQERRTGRNVIARLPASREPTLPGVMLGAHLDHLGRGGGGSSLAVGEEERDAIHPGADDNASGVAAVLEIAAHSAALARAGELDTRRDLWFAAWSGEELGLLGAHHFVDQRKGENPHEPELDRSIAAYLNFDMVGRLRDRLSIQGVGTSTRWPSLLEARNVAVGLPLLPNDDAYLPTDTTAFYLAGVPTLNAFTGVHEDYHRPSDTADKLDYEGIARIARLFSAVALSLAREEEAPDYVAVSRPRHGMARAGLRAYLGTIPDYTSEVQGLRLSGVVEDGPAERGGLRAGDVVVRVGPQLVENIYDYTYALEALKVGEAVDITVRREGEEQVIRVVPESRE